MARARRAQVDAVTSITKPTVLPVDAGGLVVVTRTGVVLVDRQASWTWYRLVMGGRWWSLTVGVKRSEAQATREAGRLSEAVLERVQRMRRADDEAGRDRSTREGCAERAVGSWLHRLG